MCFQLPLTFSLGPLTKGAHSVASASEFEFGPSMEDLMSLSIPPTKLPVLQASQYLFLVKDIITIAGVSHDAKHCIGIISLNPLHYSMIYKILID
jgi:hypothetical protein